MGIFVIPQALTNCYQMAPNDSRGLINHEDAHQGARRSYHMQNLTRQFHKTKQASIKLAALSSAGRNRLLRDVAVAIKKSANKILAANRKDLKVFGGDQAVRDRLELNPKKLKGILSSIADVVKLPDPLNKILESRKRPNGLEIKKISVPLGVVGVIYESRPNVTVDLAVLALKTGNAIVLKGGKEAYESNKILVSLFHQVLKKHGLPKEAVLLIDPRTDWKKDLLSAHGLVDVLIPRGSNRLINWVRENSRLPVIETGAGVCHIFADDYDVKKSVNIIVNSKTQAPAVCNALDTLVVNHQLIKKLLPALAAPLAEWGVHIFADVNSYQILKEFYPAELLRKALPEHFGYEFLSLKMSIKTVKNFADGLAFVKKYTSGHSEAILTNNLKHSTAFLKEVDAAAVYHNVSTRFTDGGEFGMGAEVGISTQKLHARGPMGLEALTSYKWMVEGNGQARD
jgi:glutamate-5-semialdehyde dehydrogenase